MSKKQILFVIGGIVVIIGGALLAFFLPKGDKNTSKPSPTKLENEVVMYVKINPLVKLVYTEIYEECENEKGEKTTCNYIEGPIKDFELVNDDAKDVYNNLDFKGKEVFDVLIELCDTARDNHIGFKSLEISSNSKYISPEIITEEIKKNSRYETTLEVFVDFQEYVEDEKTIKELEEGKEDKYKAYTVTFDSDGGSNVKPQSIIENEMVGRPSNPTKNNYEFIEWQLDNKSFDFTSKVTSDLTLKAVWKEKEVKEEEKKEETKPEENKTEEKKEETKVEEKKEETKVEEVKPKTYTVKFDANGGSSIEAQTVTENSKVKEPTAPTKKYYEFVEWQLNSKKYDFTTPVTKDITLKAIWKETVPTLEKINLNDNILVYESGYGIGSGGCGGTGFLGFATNLETLFPGKVKNNQLVYISAEDKKRVEENGWEDTSNFILDTEWAAKKSQLTYDTTKENNMLNVFKKLQSSTPAGTTKFTYSFTNHNLDHAGYGIISLADESKFPDLNRYLTYTNNNIYSQFNSAIKDLYHVSPYGGCGSIQDPSLLDEAICKEYNLPCGRW